MKSEIAIVTGGSSGLGLEIAKKLVLNNTNVCIVSRSESKLELAKKMLVESNPNVDIITYSANIGFEDQVKNVYEYLTNYSITKLFNDAGVGRFGSPENNSESMINAVFEANLKGLILMSTYALKFMSGLENFIVNIMSTAALVGREKETVYCAAKWGARGYTEALKVATKGTKFKVIGVFPGGIKTPFWSKESGMEPDVSKFMNASDVAERIVSAVMISDSSTISDLTINRR